MPNKKVRFTSDARDTSVTEPRAKRVATYSRQDQLSLSHLRGRFKFNMHDTLAKELDKYTPSQRATILSVCGHGPLKWAASEGSVKSMRFIVDHMPKESRSKLVQGLIHNKYEALRNFIEHCVKAGISSDATRILLAEGLKIFSSIDEDLTASALNDIAQEYNAEVAKALLPALSIDKVVVPAGEQCDGSSAPAGAAALCEVGASSSASLSSDLKDPAGSKSSTESVTTVRCMTNIIYDKSLLNDNACSGGKLLKEAFRVGGIELVNKLIADGLRTASDSSCVLEYVDIRTGSLLFSFDTSCSIDSIESSAQSVVHLRPVETPELIALRKSASDPFYMPLMQVLSYIAKVPANAWHWIGGVMELIQNIVEHTLPALQTDSQTARLSFLFDLLDHVRSADPFITPRLPWGSGDPDDFGGGDSNDKKADGEGVGLMFYASSDNTSSELVNASLVGETLGLESDPRMY